MCLREREQSILNCCCSPLSFFLPSFLILFICDPIALLRSDDRTALLQRRDIGGSGGGQGFRFQMQSLSDTVRFNMEKSRWITSIAY